MARLTAIWLTVFALIVDVAALCRADDARSVAGTWKVTRTIGGEPLSEFLLDLEVKDSHLSGTARWGDGRNVQIGSSAIENGKLLFSIAPGDMIQQYTGELNGDRIEGKAAAGTAVFDWEATRESQTAAVHEHVVREFTGVSNKQDFNEALADALRQMDKAVTQEAKYPCSRVSWRLVDINGTSGTPAGLRTIQVKIAASFEGQGTERSERLAAPPAAGR